jgi:hypothetical protein
MFRGSRAYWLALCALLTGSCELAPAMGLKVDAESFYPTPFGYTEYQKSMTNQPTFTTLHMGANGLAGYSYVWINGLPMMVPVYFPDFKYVQWIFPWYDVSWIEPNPVPPPPNHQY